MVTGAYYPEFSGAGLQCRALIRACGDRIRFTVLTTTVDPALPAADEVDGVPVRRVLVSPTSRLARTLAIPRLIAAVIRSAAGADVVHLHGFSGKSRVVIALARLMRRRVVIKLTSVGHDDSLTMHRRGGGALRSFLRADRFVGVSPRFAELHAQAGLPAETLNVILNGVDVERFRPAAAGERDALRRELGLPADRLIVLFVGFFSHEKRPDVAFQAWALTDGRTPSSAIVFVGRTDPGYYEIDPELARQIRDEAERRRCLDRVVMIERAEAIERLYRAADVFILPTTREGLPNVVLEAMASGLPCIVSRLPGVTDALITSGETGLLVDPDDRGGFAQALEALLADSALRARLGARARRTVEGRFSMAAAADRYVSLYRELAGASSG
jgi:glycosyltransferase involved in cell wall biosynthesis